MATNGPSSGRPYWQKSRLSTSTGAHAPIIRPLVTLECGHTLQMENRPEIGQDVYCGFHNTITKVAMIVQEWHIKCTGCTWARSYGASPMTARVKAVAHSIKRHHVVRLMLDGKVIDMIGNQTAQLTTEDLEVPPF